MIELNSYVNSVLNRTLTDLQTISINNAIAMFDSLSNSLYDRYETDIASKRISDKNQTRIAEDFLNQHGHACSDYKKAFAFRAYNTIIFNGSMAEIKIGTFIRVYARCHAHRKIWEKYSDQLNQEQVLKKHEGEYISRESEFARFLAKLYPSASFDTWRKRIQRFREQQLGDLKNGTLLH